MLSVLLTWGRKFLRKPNNGNIGAKIFTNPDHIYARIYPQTPFYSLVIKTPVACTYCASGMAASSA